VGTAKSLSCAIEKESNSPQTQIGEWSQGNSISAPREPGALLAREAVGL
jgi:hypothetical protein